MRREVSDCNIHTQPTKRRSPERKRNEVLKYATLLLSMFVLLLLLVVVVAVVDACVVVCANVVQAAFVETHLHDLPVVAHPGGKINTKVAWRELSQVVFLVNGSRYGTARVPVQNGMVRFGSAWYGLVRCGVVWCGARDSTMWCGVRDRSRRHDTVYGTLREGAVWWGMGGGGACWRCYGML